MAGQKILAYYQTLTSIRQILVNNPLITHIHLASIHFGVDDNNNPYIHLNNDSPYSSKFDTVWKELEIAVSLGIKVKLMIGGAGGGYAAFFSNYDVYYDLLVKLLRSKNLISGIDLDIEEPVDINNVKKLINAIKSDFGDLTITMAPIQSSLETDEPGMGGFSYKELMQSSEGKYIDYFNVQFYSDFSLNAYQKIVNNGYSPEMIVMGAMAGEKNDNEIAKCVKKYGSTFGGVFVWEYCFAKPDPGAWVSDVHTIINTGLINSEDTKGKKCCLFCCCC